jgi:signal transduction histidine kinase
VICQEIIKAHGGTIKISSQIGQGTAVQIFLPNDTKSEKIFATQKRE